MFKCKWLLFKIPFFLGLPKDVGKIDLAWWQAMTKEPSHGAKTVSKNICFQFLIGEISLHLLCKYARTAIAKMVMDGKKQSLKTFRQTLKSD